ncbi:type II toxin-antitoxin system HicA family toxin [Bradyrhizobium sp. AUGA SZCCT0222]|nr:type II toxin-antitoxin system HicA family toxin [Bradyrhizobium sp. AUGA SZCCT0222]
MPHHRFRHPVSNKITIVTHPKRDVPVGTVRAIYRQLGWDKYWEFAMSGG